MTWSGLRDRFRVHDISWKDRWLVLLGFLVVDGSYIAVQVFHTPIADLMPEWMKNPSHVDTTVDPSGDYLGWVLFTGMILFNVISEEMQGRGSVLPRQELQHGKHT